MKRYFAALLVALGAVALPAAAPVTTLCTAKDSANNVIICTPVLPLRADGTVIDPSGGGGGAITAADGAIVNLGSLADAAYTSGNGTLTAIGKAQLAAALAGNTAQATAALQTTGNASLASIDAKLTAPLTTALSTSAGTSLNTSTNNGDDVGGTATTLSVGSFTKVWNGASWDRMRGDTGGTYTIASPTTIAANAIVPSISASAAATSLIAKNTPGNYYDGYCQASAAGRCILYNATTVPAAGALTASLVLECVIVSAGGIGSWNYGALPRRASIGMVMLYSSGADCNTYTVSSTAYIHASVQ